jgi:hypothetical protein
MGSVVKQIRSGTKEKSKLLFYVLDDGRWVTSHELMDMMRNGEEFDNARIRQSPGHPAQVYANIPSSVEPQYLAGNITASWVRRVAELRQLWDAEVRLIS